MSAMTSLQRVMTIVNLKEPDIVLVGPYMGNRGPKVAVVDIIE